ANSALERVPLRAQARSARSGSQVRFGSAVGRRGSLSRRRRARRGRRARRWEHTEENVGRTRAHGSARGKCDAACVARTHGSEARMLAPRQPRQAWHSPAAREPPFTQTVERYYRMVGGVYRDALIGLRARIAEMDHEAGERERRFSPDLFLHLPDEM